MTTAKEPPAGPKSSSFLKSVVSKLRKKDRLDTLANDTSDKINSDRCDFTFSDGRQCRTPRAQFCTHHERSCGEKATSRTCSPSNESGAPELPGLEGLCADLTTATNINRAISHVFLLMAQGRISQKQAVAFGYLSQLLLQTVPGIRSEFVSAYGYEPWEEKLTSSLERNEGKDPGPSGGQKNGTERGKSKSSNPAMRLSTDKSARESRGSYRKKGVKKKRPLSELVTDPDYESLLNRSLDMFAGKYSTTPEGRREEKALLTELELIGPPAPKTGKGVRASAIDYMRQWIREGTEPDAAPSVPPALNWYGHPIKPAVPIPDSAPPTRSWEPSSASTPVSGVQSERGVSPNSFVSPEAFFAPNNLDPLPQPLPGQSNIPPNTEGHTTDWYAPPSWTKNRASDPFPNRQEKLKRKLGGMSNSKLRRLQHLNSRPL